MANVMYNSSYDQFAMGGFHWKASGGDTFRAFLIDTAGYTCNTATHVYLSSVSTSYRIGNNNGTAISDAAALTLIDPTGGGICDASDVTFAGISASSTTYEAVLIFKDEGTDAASHLVCYLDTAYSGLPVTPNGNNIIIQWDNGTYKIFQL